MLSKNTKTIFKSVCAIAMGLISINDEYKQEHYSRFDEICHNNSLSLTVRDCQLPMFYDATDLVNIFRGHYIFCCVQKRGSFKSTDFLLEITYVSKCSLTYIAIPLGLFYTKYTLNIFQRLFIKGLLQSAFYNINTLYN